MFEKIKLFLKEFDFVWSIPIGFIIFLLYPVFGSLLWGDGFSSYSPEFFHASIYAGLVTILFNSFAQMGIYFNFPELYQYYLGENFKELKSWERISTFLFVLSLYFVVLFLIWKEIV